MSFLPFFREIRDGIIDTIKEAPELIPEIVQFHSNDVMLEEEESMLSCKREKSIPEFRIGWIESPSVIECDGTLFIFTTSEVPEIVLKEDNEARIRARRILESHPSLKLCHCNVSKELRYFHMDTFTTRTLIRYIVQDIFEKDNLPHCSTLHAAYVSNGQGYALYDMIDIGSFQDFLKKYTLDTKKVKDILMQLIVIFDKLSEYNYNHGTASSQSLLFREDMEAKYEYKGMRLNSDFVIQLTDMWHSSITYYGNHFFEKSDFSTMPHFAPHIEQKRAPLAYCQINHIRDLTLPLACASTSAVCFEKKDYDLCEEKDVIFFRFVNNTYEIYRHMRNLGVPLFSGAFDFYCIFISLMCNKKFYEVVKNSDELQRLWLLMWLPDDYVEVEKMLSVQHGKSEVILDHYTKVRQAVDILRKKFLRCDVLDEMINILKE